jgi:sec-independent protein translocase protein TatA
MPTLGPWELIVVLLIVVVIFGAGRLSEVGGAVGKSIKEFRKATTDDSQQQAAQQHQAVAEAPPAVAPLAPSAPTAVLVENKCPSCATVNPVGQVFCGQCGTRLTRAA